MLNLSSSRPVFAILAALIEEHTGLHYGAGEQPLFMERLGARAAAAGFESLLDYYYFLRYDEGSREELEKLVDSLVVNETYFFRELQPLRVLVERFLRPMVLAGQRPRVWSAACATGEEPLTLAMLLAEADLLGRVELLASDISKRALERASTGRFSKRSLREMADSSLARQWLEQDETGVRVSPALIQAISWRRINLCDPTSLATVPPCDVILCRNVLIYFSDEKTAQVIRGFADLLPSQGVLLVGISESISRFGSAFTCEEVDHIFCYRKST